jgi:DNA-binding Lrp family transcriptional regulator
MKSEPRGPGAMRALDAPTLPHDADLDVRILRVMYASRGVSISGIDPRFNANRIARELGVSRATVAARLRGWADSGFVERYDVWPNPYLFELTGATFDIRVADRLAKDALIARIGLVPGAVGGLDFVGEWMAVTFVLPRDADPRRTAALLRGISGVAEVGEAVPWAPPESSRTLSPLELRIVRVLRRYPTETLAQVARHVGVSTRTITSRYARLMDEHAVWFVPAFDFRAMSDPVLSINLQFESVADRASFGRALDRTFARTLEFRRTAFGPALPDTFASYFVVLRSAARIDDVEAWTRAQPGVVAEETLVMSRILSFPETFDQLIREVRGASRAGDRAAR